MDQKALVKAAIAARENSYSPYSKFMVGAALLAKNGTIYRGANIENAGYSPTICAERSAFVTAATDGERAFDAIAVAGWGKDDLDPAGAFPCGVCRQFMMEFCDPATFLIIVAKSEDDYTAYGLEELLPHGFGPLDLKEEKK
ncbi:MAG: cytidine deaminase [Oscillospiraceae bacterium]|nr:cytidine deaminase [Oscillospiraceae bacterium]